jgi:hypothetical protein
MSILSRRVCALSAGTSSPTRPRPSAERGRRISDILANATGNVLHLLRVVMDPTETEQMTP